MQTTTKKSGYFNPRSHEGSDFIWPPFLCQITNFNPRSHEGSDHVQLLTLLFINDFNPRSHEGSDQEAT